MKTKYFDIPIHSIDPEAVSETVQMLKSGKCVIFPTETVYGLGADATNEAAVQKIFSAKGRPSDNPLIVHIGERKQVYDLAREVPGSAERLMDEFWGGPLTIILKKKDVIPSIVSAGLDTVGIRMPSHPVANAILRSGIPVAAPSANRSGRPSPTNFSHCVNDMDGRVDAIINGGESKFGVESTVIDLTGSVPMILRPGAVTLEMIREILPDVVYGNGREEGVPKSPGMKYRHYAPQASLTVIKHPQKDELNRLASHDKVGIMAYRGIGNSAGQYVVDMGENTGTYGARLFFALRQMDDWNVHRIYAVAPEETGFGAAVCNRLYKAAGGNVIE